MLTREVSEPPRKYNAVTLYCGKTLRDVIVGGGCELYKRSFFDVGSKKVAIKTHSICAITNQNMQYNKHKKKEKKKKKKKKKKRKPVQG